MHICFLALLLAVSPVPLRFGDFFDPSPRELKPSARLLAMNGKRVRITGFMARMEVPPAGGFYLVPRPVVCDEAGAGTADLPPEAVLVLARSAQGKPVPFSPRVLEVTGILALGNHFEPDGRVSAIRIALDPPRSAKKQSHPQPRSTR